MFRVIEHPQHPPRVKLALLGACEHLLSGLVPRAWGTLRVFKCSRLSQALFCLAQTGNWCPTKKSFYFLLCRCLEHHLTLKTPDCGSVRASLHSNVHPAEQLSPHRTFGLHKVLWSTALKGHCHSLLPQVKGHTNCVCWWCQSPALKSSVALPVTGACSSLWTAALYSPFQRLRPWFFSCVG